MKSVKAFCFGCGLGFGWTIRYKLKLEKALLMLRCNHRQILLYPILQHMPSLICFVRGLHLALQRLWVSPARLQCRDHSDIFFATHWRRSKFLLKDNDLKGWFRFEMMTLTMANRSPLFGAISVLAVSMWPNRGSVTRKWWRSKVSFSNYPKESTNSLRVKHFFGETATPKCPVLCLFEYLPPTLPFLFALHCTVQQWQPLPGCCWSFAVTRCSLDVWCIAPVQPRVLSTSFRHTIPVVR